MSYKIENAQDMIPMVYPTTMKIDPIIYQLNREHEEIMKKQDKNPGASFAELTEKYYAKKDQKEKDLLKKQLMNSRSVEAPENYLPTKIVKKRMDSEHLNDWMQRGEIQ